MAGIEKVTILARERFLSCTLDSAAVGSLDSSSLEIQDAV